LHDSLRHAPRQEKLKATQQAMVYMGKATKRYAAASRRYEKLLKREATQREAILAAEKSLARAAAQLAIVESKSRLTSLFDPLPPEDPVSRPRARHSLPCQARHLMLCLCLDHSGGRDRQQHQHQH
jgi:hypothetical protein